MLTLQAYGSSIGKKIIMGVTGAILVLFILGHLAGNLLIFLGPDAINAYSKKLIDLGPLLWVARIGLLTAVLLHIWMAIWLVIENRKARPVQYHLKRSTQTTYAARTMAISGFIVLGFIIYHLLHFTFHVTNPNISHLTDTLGRHDVYSMVILSFQNIYISIAYIISLALLCMHLSHGIGSVFQSLGFNNEKTLPILTWSGRGLAVLIFLGYIFIPLAALLGLLKPLSVV